MKKYFYTAILFLSTTFTYAQIDEARMKKDLEVASTVLSSLLEQEGIMYWNGMKGEPRGQYIEGYGAVLYLPNNHLIFGNIPVPPKPSFEFHFDDEDWAEDIEVIVEEAEHLSEKELEEMEKHQEERMARAEELAEREQELAIKAERLANKTIRFLRLDSMKVENNQKRLEKMKSFLVDYAHLISQLNPKDKILLVDKGNIGADFPGMVGPDRLKNSRLSAEITMKDVMEYQKGNISREEALSRISVNKNNQPKRESKDLELFNSMMNRLYSDDLSDTFYKSGMIRYEQADGLGAIFYFKTVSSTLNSNNTWNVPTVNKTNISDAERKNVIKELYPKFESQLVDNIVSYGRTIQSLSDEEKLIFNVKITQCGGCNIPRYVEITVDAKDLKAFNSGKISKKEAIDRVIVKQGEMQ